MAIYGLAVALGSIAVGLSILYYFSPNYEKLPPDLIGPDEATKIAREELMGIGYLPGFHSIELIYVHGDGTVFKVNTDGSLEEQVSYYAEVLQWDRYYWIVSFYPPLGNVPERGLIIIFRFCCTMRYGQTGSNSICNRITCLDNEFYGFSTKESRYQKGPIGSILIVMH